MIKAPSGPNWTGNATPACRDDLLRGVGNSCERWSGFLKSAGEDTEGIHLSLEELCLVH